MIVADLAFKYVQVIDVGGVRVRCDMQEVAGYPLRLHLSHAEPSESWPDDLPLPDVFNFGGFAMYRRWYGMLQGLPCQNGYRDGTAAVSLTYESNPWAALSGDNAGYSYLPLPPDGIWTISEIVATRQLVCPGYVAPPWVDYK